MKLLSRPGSPARPFIIMGMALMLSLAGTYSFASKPPLDGDSIDSTYQFAFPEGRYLYKFSWNGIPSAESELTVTVENRETQPYYFFEGTARTSKFVDIFWKFRASMVAMVDALTGKTLKLRIRDQQNQKTKTTETVFNYDSAQAYYTKWKKDKVDQKTIELRNGTLDPASLCLLLSNEKLQVGDTGSTILLVEDDIYEMNYSVTARDQVNVVGCIINALRIEPTFRLLGKPSNKPPKLNLITLWVSESEPRIPLKMQTKTFIGHVTAELAQVTPL